MLGRPSRPQERIAFVFPGQGSQYVGMGKSLYEASEAARQVFHQADQVLGFALTKLMFEGPVDELEDTINAQPAILTLSVACLAALREKWTELGNAMRRSSWPATAWASTRRWSRPGCWTSRMR